MTVFLNGYKKHYRMVNFKKEKSWQRLSATIFSILSLLKSNEIPHDTCQLCQKITKMKRLRNEDSDEIENPILKELRDIIKFDPDGNSFIKWCQNCGQFYYYKYFSRGVSSIIDDNAEWVPARILIRSVNPGEATSIIKINYDISPFELKLTRQKDGLYILKFALSEC